MSHDPIVEFTSKLPLGGRYAVGLLLDNASRARRRGDRTSQYTNSALLAGLSGLHGIQAAIGFSSLLKPGNGTRMQNTTKAAVCSVYIGVNGLAAYTQAKVAFQAAQPVCNSSAPRRSDNRPRLRLFGKSSYSPEQTVLDTCASLGINAAFAATVLKDSSKRPAR